MESCCDKGGIAGGEGGTWRVFLNNASISYPHELIIQDPCEVGSLFHTVYKNHFHIDRSVKMLLDYMRGIPFLYPWDREEFSVITQKKLALEGKIDKF